LRSTAGNTITFTVNGAVNTRSFNPCNTAGDNVSTVTVGASGSLTVGSPITGGTVDFGNPNQIITGEGSFTLRPTAYLQIGSPNGLNPTTGPIRVSTRSFSKLAHYTYMGAAAQVTGAELPDSIGLLTVNNSANLTLTNPVFLNNGISFNAGKLFTGSNDIVFGPSASSSGTYSDAINLVAGTGLVKKMFSGTGSFTFPLGDTTGTAEQSPIRLSFTTGTFSPTAYVTAKVVNGMHPNNTSAFSYLNRYWTLTPSGISNFTADVVAKYPNADAVGTETDIYCGKWNGSNWTGYANVDAVNDSIKAYTITSFSDFSGGEMSAMGGVNGLMTCKFAPEGYYDTGLNRLAMRDTFTVYLANTTTPYAFVDSSLITIDSVSLSGIATFANAANGTYYLAVKGRNIVETWSKTGGETFTKGGQMSYDFTSAQAQSYGSNAVVKGSKWCIYSGDVTQDGFIDFSDLSQVDNDQYNFVGGYVVTDLTGDMFVDFSDLSLCDNNQYNFIGTVKPGGKRIAKPVRPAVNKTMLPY
jgi:hypothetical protein